MWFKLNSFIGATNGWFWTRLSFLLPFKRNKLFATQASSRSVCQRSFSINDVMKPALLLSHRAREDVWRGWNREAAREAPRTHRRWDLKLSGYVTFPEEGRTQRDVEEEEEGVGKRERGVTVVHFNGIYRKAQKISSWVLDVWGSKKPFRLSAAFYK